MHAAPLLQRRQCAIQRPLRRIAAIYTAHERFLAEAGTLDAGDLVLHAFRLLREKREVRARLSARFGHVLVDELQDASFAQGLLLRLLVAEHRGITACADDDQAKAVVETLVFDLGAHPVDAGPLAAARLVEPAMLLLTGIASAGHPRDVALRLLERT